MAKVERFEDIEAWKRARSLTQTIYEVSRTGLFSRDYALCNQLRRATISIMSNIAEGFERDGNKEFAQFLSIAKGSTGEVRSQLYVALDAGYIDLAEFETLSNMALEISRMLNGFMRYQQTELNGRKNT